MLRQVAQENNADEGLTEFCRLAAKESKIIFDRGMHVGENTSQTANVRGVRLQRTESALQRAAKNSKKMQNIFFDSKKGGRPFGRPPFQ